MRKEFKQTGIFNENSYEINIPNMLQFDLDPISTHKHTHTN